MTNQDRVAIVGGARTPFAKAGTGLREYSALDLATSSVEGALKKLDLDPDLVDQLVYGIVTVDPRVPHLAREINLATRLPDAVRSTTVTDNCITSITAIEAIHDAIGAGRTRVGIAGGVESMSNPSVLWSRPATTALSDLRGAKRSAEKARILARLRPRDLLPHTPGTTEPSTGLSMGEHTEITVKQWEISRIEQDEIAYRSHMNAAAATDDGRLQAEIHPLGGIGSDTIIRPDTSMDKLAALRPAFDLSGQGSLTAGNSSPLTDGAASVVLMAESAAAEHRFSPLAYIKAIEFAAISPDDGLLMAPGVAVPRMLNRVGMSLDDFDLVEMHEAFGGQVAANLAAWEHGWKEDPIGKIDRDKLNQLGGSIAIGHPFAATGARIVTQLANEMARRSAEYGLISICGAGATAAAMILERN